MIIDRGKDNVENQKHSNVEGMADSRGIPQEIGKRTHIVRANGAWPNEIWIELSDGLREERHISSHGEDDWCTEASYKHCNAVSRGN